MLVHLDTNLVQYCADYGDFLFGAEVYPPREISEWLQRELVAFRELIEVALEIESRDTENRGRLAGPRHLGRELWDGQPTREQREVYRMLGAAWIEDERAAAPAEERVQAIDLSLSGFDFSRKDRRLLAEVIALEASWFLTCDKRLRRNAQEAGRHDTLLRGLRVAFPTECAKEINFASVFGMKSARGSHGLTTP